jgi:serine/threonine protein kinase
MTDRLVSSDGTRPDATVSADVPVVPGYEVLEELGRGGMGVVYRARQMSPERWVALKLIRDGALASSQERARFRIEAEAAGRMRHANIVAIHEVGEHHGRPFFAMELVEGPSLDRHLASQPQPARHAAELLQTLALAVAHAHAQNVIHRDLKPANILVGTDGVPKITDFGLAKRLDSQSTAWTQEGAVVGTASYMPPEQAAGRVGAIGPAVDIYALGAILYELLTGRPPFHAPTWQQTIEQVLHDEPAPPTRVRSDVPAALDTICLKCLEKDPPRRYTSAAELAEDLGRYLNGEAIAAVPLSADERLTRLAARDGFQLVGTIGRGPCSTVYRALSGALAQPVAVKVFQTPQATRAEWEARLRRDADAWGAVAHPQIVPVQRAGWWDDRPFVVMEYVPNGTLAARLVGKPYPIQEALRLAEQLAEIVVYLHRQGVVHGNLKPSNVLFAADGIPRLSDRRAAGGLFQGTLPEPDATGMGYLAPEMVRDIDAAPRPYTDSYGLGLILYELLTGRPPFAAATAPEVLEQVRTHDPVPPSAFNVQVSPDMDAACLRCLNKNPWHRYSRVYNLMMKLRSLQEPMHSAPGPGKRRDVRH